jgi:hypothetical protein
VHVLRQCACVLARHWPSWAHALASKCGGVGAQAPMQLPPMLPARQYHCGWCCVSTQCRRECSAAATTPGTSHSNRCCACLCFALPPLWRPTCKGGCVGWLVVAAAQLWRRCCVSVPVCLHVTGLQGQNAPASKCGGVGAQAPTLLPLTLPARLCLRVCGVPAHSADAGEVQLPGLLTPPTLTAVPACGVALHDRHSGGQLAKVGVCGLAGGCSSPALAQVLPRR